MHEPVLLSDRGLYRQIDLDESGLNCLERRPKSFHELLELEAGADALPEVRVGRSE